MSTLPLGSFVDVVVGELLVAQELEVPDELAVPVEFLDPAEGAWSAAERFLRPAEIGGPEQVPVLEEVRAVGRIAIGLPHMNDFAL